MVADAFTAATRLANSAPVKKVKKHTASAGGNASLVVGAETIKLHLVLPPSFGKTVCGIGWNKQGRYPLCGPSHAKKHLQHHVGCSECFTKELLDSLPDYH